VFGNHSPAGWRAWARPVRFPGRVELGPFYRRAPVGAMGWGNVGLGLGSASEMTVKIDLAAQDPHDQDMLHRNQVYDGVPGVMMDANRWPELCPLRGHHGRLSDEGYGLAETLFISIRLFGPEPFHPIPIALDNVVFCPNRDLNLHGIGSEPVPPP